jgi:hypothetical protein
MVEHKQKQSGENLELVLAALDELDKPVSSSEIEHHLRMTAHERAESDVRRRYEFGEIGSGDIDRSRNSNSTSLRTVQRCLEYLRSRGFVERVVHNKYSLSITGKRELMFREFAQAYGTTSLNRIMDVYFPTLNSLDKNIGKLVEIFGIYVVNAVIEAARLIAANRDSQDEHWKSSFFGGASNFRDGKFREGKLVKRWIKDVFDPWSMLNIFLTAISNSADRTVLSRNANREKVLIRRRIKKYQNESPSQIVGVPINSILRPKNDEDEPSTLELMFRRISEISENADTKMSRGIVQNEYFRFLKVRSRYGDDNLLYEPNYEKAQKLKNSLRKQYPLYGKLLEKTDDSFYSK